MSNNIFFKLREKRCSKTTFLFGRRSFSVVKLKQHFILYTNSRRFYFFKTKIIITFWCCFQNSFWKEYFYWSILRFPFSIHHCAQDWKLKLLSRVFGTKFQCITASCWKSVNYFYALNYTMESLSLNFLIFKKKF